ncbi:hypothetical protein EYZ11_003945 [Aspergillus tanneri]|uniref:Uncharacterized protein n=1 Tax=Aspergillus tanneri TaxID=1220188 RepID=A0A4S3JM40_9EURO|nr:hypothetical protein EYZ11_003945 [Aspergillus tanneri]
MSWRVKKNDFRLTHWSALRDLKTSLIIFVRYFDSIDIWIFALAVAETSR